MEECSICFEPSVVNRESFWECGRYHHVCKKCFDDVMFSRNCECIDETELCQNCITQRQRFTQCPQCRAPLKVKFKEPKNYTEYELRFTNPRDIYPMYIRMAHYPTKIQANNTTKYFGDIELILDTDGQNPFKLKESISDFYSTNGFVYQKRGEVYQLYNTLNRFWCWNLYPILSEENLILREKADELTESIQLISAQANSIEQMENEEIEDYTNMIRQKDVEIDSLQAELKDTKNLLDSINDSVSITEQKLQKIEVMQSNNEELIMKLTQEISSLRRDKEISEQILMEQMETIEQYEAKFKPHVKKNIKPIKLVNTTKLSQQHQQHQSTPRNQREKSAFNFQSVSSALGESDDESIYSQQTLEPARRVIGFL